MQPHPRLDAHDPELLTDVRSRLRSLAAAQSITSLPDALIDEAAALAVTDVDALTRRDPAARGDWRYALASYACLDAVLTHRLAHAAWRTEPETRMGRAHRLARRMSERAKVRTGVEIHPAARIGPGLVVDHGYGTVIGETAVLGTGCYLLQGVVLGATGIGDNPAAKRHPTLGDQVEVGAFARVLGPVHVGDRAFVGGFSLVLADVPADARVGTARTCPALSWCEVAR